MIPGSRLEVVMRIHVVLIALVVATSVAAASEPLSFQTLGEDGKAFTGRVKELQKDGVLLEMEDATTLVAWERIHPADRYRLRMSVIDENDADAQFRLAETCLAEAYYSGARRALERALALGHKDGREIQGLMDEADQRECQGMYAGFEEAVSRGEYEAAKEVARGMASRFPSNPLTMEVRKRIPALIQAEAAAKAQAERDAAEAAEEARAARREAWIKARFEEVERAVKKAKTAMVSARHYDEKTSLSRARKGYEAAERNFLLARQVLLRVRRATRSGPDFDRADREIRSVERRLLEAYLALGRMYVSQGSYRNGVLYVDRALLFDPVNPEALQLSEQIRREWIHRSLRRLTNSPGVIVR
jgi:tetratricopeptide (TPR) repeat protein